MIVNLNDDLWLVFMGKHRKVFVEILVLFNTKWFALKRIGHKNFHKNTQTPKLNFGGSKIAANLGGASQGGYLLLRIIGITKSVQNFGCSKFYTIKTIIQVYILYVF